MLHFLAAGAAAAITSHALMTCLRPLNRLLIDTIAASILPRYLGPLLAGGPADRRLVVGWLIELVVAMAARAISSHALFNRTNHLSLSFLLWLVISGGRLR
uniref:Putative secreted protein n=1 Tax=Anopheles marajoara TaxID=58244 RepID=A0A2M4C8T0_9DIPT